MKFASPEATWMIPLSSLSYVMEKYYAMVQLFFVDLICQ